jgi:hypothetical protein
MITRTALDLRPDWRRAHARRALGVSRARPQAPDPGRSTGAITVAAFHQALDRDHARPHGWKTNTRIPLVAP